MDENRNFTGLVRLPVGRLVESMEASDKSNRRSYFSHSRTTPSSLLPNPNSRLFSIERELQSNNAEPSFAANLLSNSSSMSSLYSPDINFSVHKQSTASISFIPDHQSPSNNTVSIPLSYSLPSGGSFPSQQLIEGEHWTDDANHAIQELFNFNTNVSADRCSIQNGQVLASEDHTHPTRQNEWSTWAASDACLASNWNEILNDATAMDSVHTPEVINIRSICAFFLQK